MTEEQKQSLKSQCLQMAIDAKRISQKETLDILEIARQYYEFITGEKS
jgi:hypothetical protein